MKNPFRRKSVPRTPCVSPSNGRRQAWADDSDNSLQSTPSVLDTILGCLKPSRPSKHPSNVQSSSSLDTNDFPSEDVLQLGVISQKLKKKKKKKKKKKSRRGSGKKRVTSGNKKGRSSSGIRNLRSRIMGTNRMEVDSPRSSGKPHNLEYTQSATPASSSKTPPPVYYTGAVGPSLNLSPHFMKRNHRKVGCDMYYADSSSMSVGVSPKNVFVKKPKHVIIEVKAAEQDDSNVIGSTVPTPLPRQTPEISAAMSNDPRIRTNSPSSSFDTERLFLESPNISARGPVKLPSHNKARRTSILKTNTSLSSNCWEDFLSDNSVGKATGLSPKEVGESPKPCSEKIDTAWLAAMGGIGAFNAGSKSLRMVETEEKPIPDMSYEERKEARRRYCLHIQEQRENISRLQKRQQKVRGNMEELTNMISRVKRSVGRHMDITSTYAVELKIMSLKKKHSAAKEGLYVLENEINQKMFKVKELSNNIAQLKLLDAEDDAGIDIFEEVNEVRDGVRARPLGAHGSRIRSRTENMQRYLPYSYTQRESASDEEKRKIRSMDVQNILDNARKHLERHSCGPSYSGTRCVSKVEEENSDDEFAI